MISKGDCITNDQCITRRQLSQRGYTIELLTCCEQYTHPCFILSNIRRDIVHTNYVRTRAYKILVLPFRIFISIQRHKDFVQFFEFAKISYATFRIRKRDRLVLCVTSSESIGNKENWEKTRITFNRIPPASCWFLSQPQLAEECRGYSEELGGQQDVTSNKFINQATARSQTPQFAPHQFWHQLTDKQWKPHVTNS